MFVSNFTLPNDTKRQRKSQFLIGIILINFSFQFHCEMTPKEISPANLAVKLLMLGTSQKKAHFILLSLAALLCQPSHTIGTEDVHKLATEFSTLTSSTYDIISKLKHISKHAVTFVRAATPVASLLAAGAEIAFPPDSPEYTAIKELHPFVSSKFSALTRHIDHHANELNLFGMEETYFETVTRPLNSIEWYHLQMIDPTVNHTIYKAGFIARCKDIKTSPMEILMLLRERLVKKCPPPSESESDNFADAFKIFKKIEQRCKNNFTINSNAYDRLKQALLARAMFDDNILNKLKNIRTLSDADQIQEALESLSMHWHLSGSICWTKTIMETNGWLRDSLVHFCEFVRLDIMRTTMLATQCANISSNGDHGRTEAELQTIELLLQEITNYLADWVEKKLQLSWPKIMSGYATAALGHSLIDESFTNYQRAAWDVKRQMDKMGPANYFHNVIIVKNWVDPRQISKRCSEHYCFQFNEQGVNVLVVRYQDNQYERANNAVNWTTQSMKIIGSVIEKWYETSGTENLDTLMQKLSEEVDGFADPDLFGNNVLIRNWAFLLADSAITLGHTNTYIRGIPTQSFYNAQFDPLVDAESYHLHMFL